MSVVSRLGGRWHALRRAFPGADHLGKALGRYFEDSSDRLAAAITFYGFLCLFPLLLVVGSVVGFVVRDNPERRAELLAHLGDFVPDSLADRLVQLISDSAGTTGILGLVGLTVAGLGWVDTLRESLRSIWHQAPHAGNIVVKKLVDSLILVGLGATILASIAVSGFATSLTGQGLALLGIPEDRPLAVAVIRVVALLLALLSNVAILAYLLRWLPRTAHPFGRVLRGAVVGAVILEAAKYLGFYYFSILIGRGADLYGGSLAAAFGLLLWINITARFIMFTAAWTVTAPYRDDVRPSGTAPKATASDPAATDAAAARDA
ncbi:MAG: YihY/virulence factor BrkB family protein [Actinomycetota bacterium]|nr:YihY/virulence factor BrkB family protein [Actinomycetota bacterium]